MTGPADAAAVALAVGWLLSGLAVVGVVFAVVRSWWRDRRAERAADRLGPRVRDDGGWAPEWEADWP